MKKLLTLFLILAAQVAAQPEPGGGLKATVLTSVRRIVAGTTTPVTDSAGQVWSPDAGPPPIYNLGTPASCPHTAPPASGAPTPPGTVVYTSARVGSATAGPMLYTFTGLTAGNYQVTLYFDECFQNGSNKRVFNIQIQGLTAFTNVDIFAAVGKNAAYVLNSSAKVTSTGTLTVGFVTIPGKDIPIIDAIQISSVAATATLKWTDTANPAGSVTYSVYRALGSCTPVPTFTKIATGLNVMTYSDPTIAPAQGYCYQITAVTTQTPLTESPPCTAVYLPGSISACTCQ